MNVILLLLLKPILLAFVDHPMSFCKDAMMKSLGFHSTQEMKDIQELECSLIFAENGQNIDSSMCEQTSCKAWKGKSVSFSTIGNDIDLDKYRTNINDNFPDEVGILINCENEGELFSRLLSSGFK